MKKFIAEFKEFISRGDVMSMAIGIIIGGAFTAIVNSLVEDIITPYLDKKEYDYIFVAVRLGDLDKNIEIPIYDWIGLRRNGFTWNRVFKYKITKRSK